MSPEPTRILCLADDLTGLAEVAGLIANLGVQATLFVEPGRFLDTRALPREGVVFVNLGCRSLPGEEAKKRILDVLDLVRGEAGLMVYLKVDSAVRGPIAALLEGVFEALEPIRIPVLVANPSQGRATRKGMVLIDGWPLHKTSFGKDPIHPRISSYLPDLLGCSSGQRCSVLSAPGDGSETGVCLLDADSDSDVERWATYYQGCAVAAGAAPFGVQLLRKRMGEPFDTPGEFPRFELESTLFVVGTCHPSGPRLVQELARCGCSVLPCDAGTVNWKLPLAICAPETEQEPEEVMNALIETAFRAIELHRPKNVFVTGGETAQSLIRKLGIATLQPKFYHRHVAVLAVTGGEAARLPSFLAMKPGSYYREDLLESLFTLRSDQAVGNARFQA